MAADPIALQVPRARTQVSRRSLDLVNAFAALGIVALALPWAIRTASEHFDALASVRITPVYVAATVILAAAAGGSLISGRTPVRRLSASWQMWLAYVVVATFGMLFVGVLRGNPTVLFVQESVVLVLFLAGIILGASFHNWPTIEKSMLAAMALLGMTTVTLGLLSVGNLDVTLLRRGTIYSASVVLMPATFFVICLARLRSRRAVMIAVIAFIVWTILQILFLKRAPLLRAGASVALGLFFLPPIMRRQRFALWLGAFLIALFAGSTLFVTETGRRLRDSVLERFQVFDVIGAYVEGVRYIEKAERYDLETFRFREVSMMLDNMRWDQRMYGIGTGGYISDPRLTQWEVTIGDRVIPSAKSAVHIGAFWSFLKGGLIFFVLFNAGLIAILVNWRRLREDPLAVNCLLFVGVNYAFTFLEGFWMQPGAEGLTFMMGAAVGYCMLRASDASSRLPREA